MVCARCGSPNRDAAAFCDACGDALAALRSGTVLQDRYRLDVRLGHGAMGAVYKVRDLRLDCDCALKELTLADAEAVTRFEHEARLLRRLTHAGLPRVHDYFSDNGRWYLVQDFVDGATLEAAVTPFGMPEEEVVEVALGVLEILSYLHGQAIIHRDIKPANLMRSAGRVVLVDFGIARQVISATGTSIGTEGYAPPEQYRGKAEPRSDLYALGATMHHLLSGKPPDVPFHFEPVARISAPLQRVLDRALDRDVARRPDSADEMADALRLVVKSTRTGVLRRVTVPLQAHGPTVPKTPASKVPPKFATVPRGQRTTAGDAAAPRSARVTPGDATRPRRASDTTLLLAEGLRPLPNNAHGFQEAVNPRDGTVLIRVPAGRFVMGSRERPDENPPHERDVAGFWIARTPVTVAQFRRFVDETGHYSEGDWKSCGRSWGENAPVAFVSWNDAGLYGQWAGLRLLTEDEWEYAAGGPSSWRFPWGNAWNPARCRHDSEGISRGAVSVGSYPDGASPFGCLDMVGTLWEWVSSLYEPYPGGSRRDLAYGLGHRVLRGGSWQMHDPADFRCAVRHHADPDACCGGWGFRLAMTAAT